MNFDNKDSFFYRILKVLELYELPDIASLKQQLPTKTVWKDSVLRSVTAYWRESLVRDAQSKTTLKFLKYENTLLGEVHPVWASTEKLCHRCQEDDSQSKNPHRNVSSTSQQTHIQSVSQGSNMETM